VSEVALPWAQRIIDAAASLWAEVQAAHPALAAGYAVFASPIPGSVRLLFVGSAPGGGVSRFDPAAACTVPADHEYLVGAHHHAVRMRELFAAIGRPDLLQESVKVHLNFYRVREQDWRKLPPQLRARLERYCEECVAGIGERLTPAIVLAEGMAVFDRLCKVFAVQPLSKVVGKQGAVAGVADLPWGGRLMGLVHPSDGKAPPGDLLRAERALAHWVAESGV
jgi:hypothetical protein